MLCVWLSAAAFLHQNSHLPRTLHALCSLLLFYFFFLLFSSCTEVEFLVAGQRPFTVHKLHQKHFCTLHLTKSDPVIRRAQEFQARFYFPVLGTVRGRHTHCVLLREASSVQDERKIKVVASITCTQWCLQSFRVPLSVLLLKLWRVIFNGIPLSPSEVCEVCADTYSSQNILIVAVRGGYLDRWDFSELFVQHSHIQLLSPWACLVCEQISATTLPLSALDLREVQTNLTHCLDPLWKPLFESPCLGDTDS